MTAQARKDRVPAPAEVWGLARAEAKAAVARNKADGPDGVAAAALAKAVAKGKAAGQGAEQTSKTNYRTF